MKNKPITTGLTIKCCLLLLLLLLNITLFKSTIKTVAEEASHNSHSAISMRLDSEIAAGEYNELLKSLSLKSLYAIEYDSYYEIANAYTLLCDYKVWSSSPQNADKAAKTKEKLQKLCVSSPFEKNIFILKSFVEQCNTD